MLKEAPPTKPVGTSPFWFFMRGVWEYLWGGKFPFKNSPTIEFEWVGGNWFANAINIKGGTSTTVTTSDWYRGLWTATPETPYMALQVVQFGAGTSSGMYISTMDNNTNQPDTGVGWTQISSSSGTWI